MSRLLTSQRIRRLGLSFLTGILVILALPPHNQWWLAWFALVPMLIALIGATPKEAFWNGALAGITINLVGFHWLSTLMERFSTLGPTRYLVMLVMACYQCLPYALWCLILRCSWKVMSVKRRRLGFVVCLTSLPALEYFHPLVFPWYLANTQHSQPLVLGVVELGGCGALSLAIVLVNLCLARVLISDSSCEVESHILWPRRIAPLKPLHLLGLCAATLLALVSFSLYRAAEMQRLEAQAEHLNLALVQPNHWIHKQSDLETLHAYQRLTSQVIKETELEGQSLDLILWPESAVRTSTSPFVSSRGEEEKESLNYPLDLESLAQGRSSPAASLELETVSRAEILSPQRGHTVPLLFGTSLEDQSPGAVGPLPGRPPLYNCGVLLNAQGEVQGIVRKVKLILFGETIPFSGTFPWIYRLLPLARAILPGEKPTTLDFDGTRLGMMICYEDILPWFHSELAKSEPEILINITNDAWFGKTAAAEAHLALAKLRTIEGRVWLVRSTPTGVSVVVNASGRVVKQIEQDRAGAIWARVPRLEVTTLFERFGNTVVWTSLLLLLIFLSWSRLPGTSKD